MKKINEKLSYPLLPLRDVIVFPHMVIPLFVGREKSIKALDSAMQGNRLILLSAQKNSQVSLPDKADIFNIGTVAEILQMLKLPNGTIKVLVEGLGRAYIEKVNSENKNFLEANIRIIERPVDENVDFLTLKKNLIKTFEEYINVNKKIPAEILNSVNSIDDLSYLSDIIASHIILRLELKQSLIEMGDPIERIKSLIKLIDGEIEVLRIEKKIHNQVRKQMEKTQKDYYLNEQMKMIKKELGDDGDSINEIDELKKSVENAKMPKEAHEKAFKEIKRLEKMPPLSAESSVVRNYIEWLRDIPWHSKTKDKKDIELASKILDDDHYGLEEVKERIIEFIAVRHLSNNTKGPIICFVGPPGVGKTSLGRSVANALGRKFARISLGGVRDEAEIRGHRRTYVGSLPGKIIQAMKKIKKTNPVILLDEIDKMSTDFRGDPSSALLEVLDPEQNNSFVDHYIELPYDLSDVLFITTSNVQHKIPLPLQDRMEIIDINSYTEHEKAMITIKYLIPKQIEQNGLKAENISISEDIILYIIRHYTKEAGVRNIERTIGKICRKVACEVVKDGKEHKVNVTKKIIKKYLGPIKFKYGKKEDKNEIGLANGLAWTSVGGDVMQIEALLIKGKGNLLLTGKLGEVMQESAKAAFTFIKANQHIFNLNDKEFSEYDVHLHVPEGAIPKDGPSAGITMAVVIASLFAKIPVRCDIAMTGEITLRGKVLPIGGLKEKILAAHRANIHNVLIPRDNKKDLEKIPDYILNDMTIHAVSKMEEVLFLSLESPDKFIKNDDKKKELHKQWKESVNSDQSMIL